MNCWYSFLNFVLEPRAWTPVILNGFIVLYFWTRLDAEFSKREQTMVSLINGVHPVNSLTDLSAENWKRVRHICSVWYAGRVFEQLHDWYGAARILAPVLLGSGMVLGGVLIVTGPKNSNVCTQFDITHCVVAGLYFGAVLSYMLGKYLRSGIGRVKDEVLKGATGTL